MAKKQNKKKTNPNKAGPKAKTSNPGRRRSSSFRRRRTGRPPPRPAAAHSAHCAGDTADAHPRLPGTGTVLQKKDLHGRVRCECTVRGGCIRYADEVYRHLPPQPRHGPLAQRPCVGCDALVSVLDARVLRSGEQ
jgi:hypothetical protein